MAQRYIGQAFNPRGPGSTDGEEENVLIYNKLGNIEKWRKYYSELKDPKQTGADFLVLFYI